MLPALQNGLFRSCQFERFLEGCIHVGKKRNLGHHLNVLNDALLVHDDDRTGQKHEIVSQESCRATEGPFFVIRQILKILQFCLFGKTFLRKGGIPADDDPLRSPI